jgi:hypothetical protein
MVDRDVVAEARPGQRRGEVAAWLAEDRGQDGAAGLDRFEGPPAVNDVHTEAVLEEPAVTTTPGRVLGQVGGPEP